MPLGTYRVLVTGSYAVPAGETAIVEVRALRGKEKIARTNLVGCGSGVVADFTLPLHRPRPDLDVRVQVSSLVYMRIESLSIEAIPVGID